MGSKFRQARLDVIKDMRLEFDLMILNLYIEQFPEHEEHIRAEFEEVQQAWHESPADSSWLDVKKLLPDNAWVKVLDQVAETMKQNPMPGGEEAKALVTAANLVRSEARKRLKGRHLN